MKNGLATDEKATDEKATASTEPAGAPAAAPPAVGDSGRWSLPAETATILRDLDASCSGVLQKLGSLEVDYLTTRNQFLEELRNRRAQFKTLVDDTARKGGLNIDRERWNLDARTMTLVRAS